MQVSNKRLLEIIKEELANFYLTEKVPPIPDIVQEYSTNPNDIGWNVDNSGGTCDTGVDAAPGCAGAGDCGGFLVSNDDPEDAEDPDEEKLEEVPSREKPWAGKKRDFDLNLLLYAEDDDVRTQTEQDG